MYKLHEETHTKPLEHMYRTCINYEFKTVIKIIIPKNKTKSKNTSITKNMWVSILFF